MLSTEDFGDVTRVAMSTAISRALGYAASAFVTRGVLIDTGCPAVARELGAFVDRLRPVGVMLTHHHEDHAGNIELLARRGVPVCAPRETLALLRSPHPIGFYRRVIWGNPSPLASAVTPFPTEALELIPTPGHSSDHHVVWDAEHETLFAGDLFLGVKVRVAHPGEDPRTLAQSVRAAAALAPKRMFDAHRGLVSNPVAALRAKADWLDQQIDTIEHLIAQGWSDRAITRHVLGREGGVYYVSRGKMSKRNFITAVRAGGRNQVRGAIEDIQ